jgi:hypothetical protein
VARGAVAYALALAGHGRRIGGGSARSYFLVLEGRGEHRRGVCILPRGSEEGCEIRLSKQRFSLRLGQPVRFHLASSVADTVHRPGEIVPLDGDDFVLLPPLATVIRTPGGNTQREAQVQLIAAMTEVGTLQLHCVGEDDAAQRWLLEFELRGDGGEAAPSAATLPPRFDQALRAIDSIFGTQTQPVDNKEARRLRGQLEQLLGKREEWNMPLSRALFDALLERARRRRRSPEHERLWLNLAGFCLRPGVGEALDPWRIEQLWALHAQGLAHGGESQNWSEWWTLWRRVAAGLTDAFQEELLLELGPWLQPDRAQTRSPQAAAISGSHDDMLRLAASLERLPVEYKVEIGDWLLGRLRKSSAKGPGWWALGRIGARQPLYGSAHQVVPPAEAGRWLEGLLAIDWKAVEPAAFAATQIARLTGDRARDLPEAMRAQVLQRLSAANAGAGWIAQVASVGGMDKADQRRAFGESLPAGLRLLGEHAAEA